MAFSLDQPRRGAVPGPGGERIAQWVIAPLVPPWELTPHPSFPRTKRRPVAASVSTGALNSGCRADSFFIKIAAIDC